jgi:hypothetical protein
MLHAREGPCVHCVSQCVPRRRRPLPPPAACPNSAYVGPIQSVSLAALQLLMRRSRSAALPAAFHCLMRFGSLPRAASQLSVRVPASPLPPEASQRSMRWSHPALDNISGGGVTGVRDVLRKSPCAGLAWRQPCVVRASRLSNPPRLSSCLLRRPERPRNPPLYWVQPIAAAAVASGWAMPHGRTDGGGRDGIRYGARAQGAGRGGVGEG